VRVSSHEDGTKLLIRDKGKRKMEVTATRDDEDDTKQLEKLIETILERHLEGIKKLEDHKNTLEQQLRDTSTILLQKHQRMLEHHKNTLEQQHQRILEQQHHEANTKLLLEKQPDDKTLLEEDNKALDKLYDRISGLQTTAFQLANYYFVSQAVVFSALATNASNLACHDVWLPLVLSLVPASLNLFAFGMIGNTYRRAIDSREQSSAAYEEKMKAAKSLYKDGENTNEQEIIASNITLKRRHTICFSVYMIAFAFFSIVITFGSIWRLCGEKILKHK